MNKIVAVVGGGPSGMSCALWLKHLGFVPILIEKNEKLVLTDEKLISDSEYRFFMNSELHGKNLVWINTY
jgi:2-polyprenyl-6-methoxyphenol hydroxylase-like FAD-dependent oxidoreductase